MKKKQNKETEVEPSSSQSHCRRFHLVRDEDVSGVSGTGIIAEGVEFANGRVVINWLSQHHTISVFDNIRGLEAIHGHEGATRIEYLDE